MTPTEAGGGQHALGKWEGWMDFKRHA